MLILVGVAGAGKSLQGQLFAAEMGFAWVSTGELFRTLLPPERQQELHSGKLIADEEVIELVDKTIDATPKDKQIVLDGFPRTIMQAQWLLDQSNSGRFSIDAIFNLVISKEVAKTRLASRGRHDDAATAVEERFKEFETKTRPLIDFFKQQGLKFYDIDASQTPEAVHADMMRYV